MTGVPQKPVIVSRIPKAGENHEIGGTARELAALAAATGVIEFRKFEASLAVQRWRSTGAVVTADVKAQVVQECVNTLDPVDTRLDFGFSRFFLAPEEYVRMDIGFDGAEMVIDPLEEELPDEITDDRIDLWEIILEELNLQIDPFVKLSDFESEGGQDAQTSMEEPTKKPFSELKSLINNKNRL